MGFFEIFKRKKEITPQEMAEMMKGLKERFEFIKKIDSVEALLPQAQALYAEIAKVEPVVNETLVSVEKHIGDLSGRTWWATAEANGKDLAGLRRGRQSLLTYKQEIDEMKKFLEDVAAKKKVSGDTDPAAEQQGPSNS